MIGSYAFVHDRGHIICDVDKVASGMIGATQDITVRKSVEIKLLESEKKLGQERLTRQKEVTHAVLAAQDMVMGMFDISDNGEGCNILEEEKGVGIINIKSRVESYHGRVTIVSKPGEGYELKVVLPLNGRIGIRQ